MNLTDLIGRAQPPIPWQEADNIPWNEPGFSERMLAEHLTQAHDRASRRSHIIDDHVAWIHQSLLRETPARILDLGCGPGLYCNRLAALGHQCMGIDYSPASIAYAKGIATEQQLSSRFLQADLRGADFQGDYDLIMLIFGELNVFSKKDASHLLKKAVDALAPGGILLLEAHTYESLIPNPDHSTHWFTSTGGLFSPTPHLALIERYWDQEVQSTTIRYYIIDAATATITRHAQSMQAYTADQYTQLLLHCGYVDVEILPGLAYDRLTPPAEFHAIISRKPS